MERKKSELDLAKAVIALDKAKQGIENQRSINREELSILELKEEQVKAKFDDAKRTMNMMVVTAPASGIAIIQKNRRTGEKCAIDDQVWSGFPLIGLPDLSLMKANVMINEVDIAKIDTNQTAFIKLEAFPDSSYRGHVSEIAALARNKDRDSKVKIFDISIILDENNEKLMPGMTVSCEIIVNKVPDRLFIPLEALFNKEGEDIVYVKNGRGFEPRKVEVGPENDNFVVIAGGLEEGEDVALAEPFEKEKEE